MLMCLHHNLVSDLIRPSLVPVEVAFGSSLCVCMSSSLSVLLVQELQIVKDITQARWWDVC